MATVTTAVKVRSRKIDNPGVVPWADIAQATLGVVENNSSVVYTFYV